MKIVLLALLLIIVLAAALTSQDLLTQEVGATRHACDLQQGPCTVELEDSRLTLEAGPRPLRSLTPITISVSIEGHQPDRVNARLQGAEMYMGINEFTLSPTAAPGHWQGKTELAVCTTGTMLWQLQIDISDMTGSQQHLFEFEAR
ncbi:hypothetical protein [Marinobacterium weihaiense]|uniref:YtkA-like domain-containing protein n=1 Tax=Marinobacterium weihaiense TaxID=2851016 RepID=A0ABS6MB87_9GAMM|nr:hypothetical protein [Marinobacterium weihaiense]MBV0933567.1 hypothetical protein [Marinobacterium weihaiense]